MPETLDSEIVSTRQQRIAELAKRSPETGFISLNHHVDLVWMREAFRRTRKDGATGIDRQTAADFEANLEANLQSLLEEAKSGLYRAPAVRRVQIPKGDGKYRPIGIPTFGDKVLQRAIAMLLEPIYEQDFKDCSYAFRRQRSPHDALDAVWKATMDGGCCVIDADIRQCFDKLGHGHIRDFVGKRIRDGMVRRLIGKWLNAGVMEDGAVWYPDEGTPQGGVISPLLANVFLHYVLDAWFVEEVVPRLRGRGRLVRFADDFIIVLHDRADAERVMAVLPKRLGKYGLTLHPEKTRLVWFDRPRGDHQPQREDNESQGPDTFNFLGFTHYWGRSRNRTWVVRRKTMASRLRRTLRRVHDWCRYNRHRPIQEQHRYLSRVIRGHCNYYGVTGNSSSLSRLHRSLTRAWHKWLGRRSRERDLTWEQFTRGILARYRLPAPLVARSVYRR